MAYAAILERQTIRRPHYELRNQFGAVHGYIQVRRGGYALVNMQDGRKGATGSQTAVYHLTNYGRGTDSAASQAALMSALHYVLPRLKGDLSGQPIGELELAAVKVRDHA